ncbi:MAG: DUF1971 domain-containing protein [Xanthobacteraceae bacterium]
MTALPAYVEAYSRSPEFNQDTLPAALRKQRSTKGGTWALIHVLEGRLGARNLMGVTRSDTPTRNPAHAAASTRMRSNFPARC